VTVEWLAIALAGEFVVLVLVVVMLGRRFIVMRRRHAVLAQEVTRMLALHQDYAASFDARLRALGSRTAGDYPIPTSAEMVGGRWER
jgi:hypothetical protein